MLELPQKALLLPQEVAKFYTISVKTVYKYVAEGKLESKKVGTKAIRITRESAKKLAVDYFV